ncbi:MAG TPA: T9SS type A sorting domain-containing protein [Flavobacteriales bacterium]|nr:T9SS type A sorting domain-containing protein [Flavobacteriales bacterium]
MKKLILLATGLTCQTAVISQNIEYTEEDLTVDQIMEQTEIPSQYKMAIMSNKRYYGDKRQSKHKKERSTSANELQIVRSFKSPMKSTYIDDLEYDGKYLWVTGYDEGKIHQISPETGKIIRSLPTNITRSYGIAFDGKHLWVIDTDNKQMQKIDPNSGDVLSTVPTPAAKDASYPCGLTWDGKNFWNNDPKGYFIESTEDDSTFLLSPEGKKIKGFKAHGGYPTGLAFDGKYLWSSDNQKIEVHKINPETFEVMETYAAPGGQYPNGLASDGKYLWIANNESDSIYQVLIPTQDEQVVEEEEIISWHLDSLHVEYTEQQVVFTPPVIITIEELELVDPTETHNVIVEEPAETVVEQEVRNNPTENNLVETVDVIAYPNPTTGLVKFRLLSEEYLENTQVMVYDGAGKLVAGKAFEGNEVMIDLTRFDSGVFVYSVISNGEVIKGGRLVKEGARN